MKNKKTQNIAVFLLITACIITGMLLFFKTRNSETYSTPFVTVNDRMIPVILAQTPEAQRKGLSGRDSLDGDVGMLFLFPEKKIAGFWMKDMKFPIDIVWISEMEIIGIEKNVNPQTGAPTEELKTYVSPGPVDEVLEINAGKADEWEVKIGDDINFKF